MEIRGGLEGSQRWRGSQDTSSANPKAGKREGPQPGPKTRNPETFGDIEERKTVVQGSPEHQLFKEAGVLKPQGPRRKACEEASMEAKGLPARKAHTRKDSKVDRTEGNFPREGIGSMIGPGNSKPGL